MNLDFISGTVTLPGAVGTLMTPVAGDSFSIRASGDDADIRLIACWTKSQLAGWTQITSPRLADNVRAIRYRNLPNQTDNKLSRGLPQKLYSQDTLQVTQVGSVTAGDVELWHGQIWQRNLPGVAATLITSEEADARMDDILTIEDTCTPGVASAYSGARLLNQGSDLLEANTLYAVTGAVIGAPCGALTIRGSDSGNLRCGIPGLSQDANITLNWFRDLSDWHGVPCIPVFNSANKAGIFIEVVQDENLAAVPFSLQLIKLRAV